jgi:hypothetical protein
MIGVPDEFIRALLQNDIKRVKRGLNGGRDPNSTEMARRLLKAGARADVVNNEGLSPLTKAESLGVSKLPVDQRFPSACHSVARRRS